MYKSLPLLGVPLAMSSLHAGKRNAECQQPMNEQEAAEELQRILESNNGEMPSDPDEMYALLMKNRPKNKRNPMGLERMMQMQRALCRAGRPNNGFTFEMGLPLGRHFMSSLLWKFSNTKPSVFETSLQLVGGSASPMADQDATPFLMMMQDSAEHLMCQGQYPMDYGITVNGVLQMDSPQAAMA